MMDLRYFSFDVAQLQIKDIERATLDSVIRNTALRDFDVSYFRSFDVSQHSYLGLASRQTMGQAVRILLPCSGGVSRVLDAGVARPIGLPCGRALHNRKES
jgi:hypothetical protein